jgi:hypothetical protein
VARSVRRGHTLLANLVVSGEVQFALTLWRYELPTPVEWVPLLVMSLVVGAFEAVFFRGFVQGRLEASFGAAPAVLAGEGALDYEFRIVLPDGRVRWIADQGEIHRNENGKPVYLTGVCTDVTERRTTEDRLRQLLLAIAYVSLVSLIFRPPIRSLMEALIARQLSKP